MSDNNKIVSLVYWGAGADFSTICRPIYDKFNRFYLMDALPKIPHHTPTMPRYQNTKNLEVFLIYLESQANKKKFLLISHNKEKQLLTFKHKNYPKIIEYYYSTTVEESLNNLEIRKKLNQCIKVHIKGFHPVEFGFNYDSLPNLIRNEAKLKEYLEQVKQLPYTRYKSVRVKNKNIQIEPSDKLKTFINKEVSNLSKGLGDETRVFQIKKTPFEIGAIKIFYREINYRVRNIETEKFIFIAYTKKDLINYLYNILKNDD